jgi:conjugative relaxase-like TrwC/TraI family protein
MNQFPCLIRSSTLGGEARYALGDPLVDSYLAFVAGRCRPNTLRAVAGFDATLSAPKSLSVWCALTGDEDLARCHDVAVAAVVEFIEHHGSTTRVRSNGHRLHPDSQGMTAAVFRQTTSRLDDPQLHSHVVISSKVQTADGRWLALDARTLKGYQRSLGGLYQSVLRAEVTARYGVAWEEILKGQAEIAGMPDGLLDVFSKRATQVDAAMQAKLAEFGTREGRDPTPKERGALGREAAADTRGHKTGTGVVDLRSRWLTEAATVGVTPDSLGADISAAAITQPPDRQGVVVDDVIAAVADRRSAWHRFDVLHAICDTAQKTETGMRSDTVAKLLHEWSRTDRPPQHPWRLHPGTTLLIDEAGMLATGDLHQLTRLADSHDWRLALIGDPHQLQAVGRGGMFAELCATGRTIELDTIHRFRNGWEAAASLKLRHGDPTGLDDYLDHDRVFAAPLAEHLDNIALAWAGSHERGEYVAITTTTNDHVDAINHAVQDHRDRIGQLGNQRLHLDGATLCVGDVITTRHNQRLLRTTTGESVRNRDYWTINTITGDGGLAVTRVDGHGAITRDECDRLEQHLSKDRDLVHGLSGSDRQLLATKNRLGALDTWADWANGNTPRPAALINAARHLHRAGGDLALLAEPLTTWIQEHNPAPQRAARTVQPVVQLGPRPEPPGLEIGF